jgi:hypothetical protein
MVKYLLFSIAIIIPVPERELGLGVPVSENRLIMEMKELLL